MRDALGGAGGAAPYAVRYSRALTEEPGVGASVLASRDSASDLQELATEEAPTQGTRGTLLFPGTSASSTGAVASSHEGKVSRRGGASPPPLVLSPRTLDHGSPRARSPTSSRPTSKEEVSYGGPLEIPETPNTLRRELVKRMLKFVRKTRSGDLLSTQPLLHRGSSGSNVVQHSVSDPVESSYGAGGDPYLRSTGVGGSSGTGAVVSDGSALGPSARFGGGGGARNVAGAGGFSSSSPISALAPVPEQQDLDLPVHKAGTYPQSSKSAHHMPGFGPSSPAASTSHAHQSAQQYQPPPRSPLSSHTFSSLVRGGPEAVDGFLNDLYVEYGALEDSDEEDLEDPESPASSEESGEEVLGLASPDRDRGPGTSGTAGGGAGGSSSSSSRGEKLVPGYQHPKAPLGGPVVREEDHVESVSGGRKMPVQLRDDGDGRAVVPVRRDDERGGEDITIQVPSDLLHPALAETDEDEGFGYQRYVTPPVSTDSSVAASINGLPGNENDDPEDPLSQRLISTTSDGGADPKA